MSTAVTFAALTASWPAVTATRRVVALVSSDVQIMVICARAMDARQGFPAAAGRVGRDREQRRTRKRKRASGPRVHVMLWAYMNSRREGRRYACSAAG